MQTVYGKITELLQTIVGRELFGISTDIKPTTGITVGTKFTEVDTQLSFRWNGIDWTGK